MSAAFDRHGLWALIAEPAFCALPDDRAAIVAAAGRLADLVSPALAAHVLAPAGPRCRVPLVEPARVDKSRLLNRFQRRAHINAARLLVQADVPFMAIKGFANAHALYDDPVARIVGDLDVLVRPRDLGAAVAAFTRARFAFRPGALPPWGFQATSSFAPLVSADGQCNIDLHTAPDSDPLDRALTADAALGASRVLEADGLRFRVPSAEHMFILCVSNAAKDKFGPYMAKKILDAGQLLRRESALDWGAIDAVLAAADLKRAAATFLGLLGALGFAIPRAVPPLPALAAGEFRRLAGEWRDVRPVEPSLFGKLRREWLLAEPRAARRAGWRRARGLVGRRAAPLPDLATFTEHRRP